MSRASNPARSSTWRWFSVARLLILGQSLAVVIMTIWNLPAVYQNLRNFESNLAFRGWNAAQLQAAAAASGVAPGVLATLLFAASLIGLLSFWGVAALLAWRKSDTWIGLLIIYILAGTGPGFNFLILNVDGSTPAFLAIYQKINSVLIWPSFFALLYLFPNGQFIPRWTRWLAPLPYLGFLTALWTDPQINNDPQNIVLNLLLWLVIIYAVGGIASQVYRYRRASTPAQRQQTKWVVYVLGILVASLVINQAVPLLGPGMSIGTQSRFWLDLIDGYLFSVFQTALIPLSIAISILRYRLWDIDLIIRRTLLYGLLSGLLGLVYFGSVVLLRQLLGGLAGESSAALVLSTLLMAALFSPLRRRVQAFIDRRFYRQKYDAAQTLEAFSAAVRNEVNLVDLTRHLTKVVDETVQPEGVSLWLRKDRP